MYKIPHPLKASAANVDLYPPMMEPNIMFILLVIVIVAVNYMCKHKNRIFDSVKQSVVLPLENLEASVAQVSQLLKDNKLSMKMSRYAAMYYCPDCDTLFFEEIGNLAFKVQPKSDTDFIINKNPCKNCKDRQCDECENEEAEEEECSVVVKAIQTDGVPMVA